jgi:protein SCO1/2
MTRRVRLAVGAAGWLAVGALAIVLASRDRGTGEEELEVLAPIAAFELTDQDGRPFGSEQLRGKVWVVGFAFTSCTSICPMLTSQMANLSRRLEPLADRAHLVTITVDPETDTPERLRAYAERHHADLRRWSFLTGMPEQVRTTLTRGFMVPIGERETIAGGGYDILHTSQLMLIDRQMRLRGLYPTDADGLARLERDVGRLLAD